MVFNHPAEMIKANPEQDPDIFYWFNLAADAAVNDAIDHEITAENRAFLVSPQGLITSQELAKMFRLKNVAQMESYAYYFRLISAKNTQSVKDSRKMVWSVFLRHTKRQNPTGHRILFQRKAMGLTRYQKKAPVL